MKERVFLFLKETKVSLLALIVLGLSVFNVFLLSPKRNVNPQISAINTPATTTLKIVPLSSGLPVVRISINGTNYKDGGIFLSQKGIEIRFDGSVDKNSDIKTFFWSFGDQTSIAKLSAVHAYKEEGEYLAVFSAEDKKGNIDSKTVIIKIGSSPVSKQLKTYPKLITGTTLKLQLPIITPVVGKEKAALIINKDLYGKLSGSEYLIEGRNPIDVYISDVEKFFPEVKIVLVNDRNFESPSEVRNTLINLYKGVAPRIADGKGINGAVLTGFLPYFKWYQKQFGEGALFYNKTVCNLCYEDLDGAVFDTKKIVSDSLGWHEENCTGSDCDGYFDSFDLKPTAQSLEGPEIWVSWIRPLISFDPNGRNEARQVTDFIIKNHQYYNLQLGYLKAPLLIFQNGSVADVSPLEEAAKKYFLPANILKSGGVGIPASSGYMLENIVKKPEYLFVLSHGMPQGVLIGDDLVLGENLVQLNGLSMVNSFWGCSTANFNASPYTNLHLSVINGSSQGLLSKGTAVIKNWPGNDADLLNNWAKNGAYFAKEWLAFEKAVNTDSQRRNWFGADYQRNLFSEVLFGNPFIRFSSDAPTLTPTPISSKVKPILRITPF